MRPPRTSSGGTATASTARQHFEILLEDFLAHARGKKLFAQDLYGGADPKYRIKVRVFTEYAWHSLFIRQLLIRPERSELARFAPEMTIVDLPSFKAGRQASRRPRRLRHRWWRSISPARSC